MNTKGNQRYHETGDRIKGALLALLKEGSAPVSVRTVCDRAQIHRTTFYGHYQDMDALLQEMVQEMYQQMMGFMAQDGGPNARSFTRLFQLAEKERIFFLYYFEQIRQGDRAEVPGLLWEHHSRLEQQMGLRSPQELLYEQTFFSAGMTALMIRWLKSGCPESPAQMGELVSGNFTRFFANDPGTSSCKVR